MERTATPPQDNGLGGDDNNNNKADSKAASVMKIQEKSESGLKGLL